MNKASIKLILLFIVFTANNRVLFSQPGQYGTGLVLNYVRTFTATAPESDANALMLRPLKDVKEVTQYFDGLGNPLQTVARKGSLETGGSPTDIISPVLYDAFGREQYQYLPFPSSGNTGSFNNNPFQQQTSFMTQHYSSQSETYFYSKNIFETSPLSRVEKSMPAGNNWVGSNRGGESKYWLNTNNNSEVIRKWEVGNGTLGSWGGYSSPGAYGAGTLYKSVSVDEMGNQVIQYHSIEGNLILKKVQVAAAADNGTGSGLTDWSCTYYIYDDLNQLRCVVQPVAVNAMVGANDYTLTQDMLDEQCFRYEYDERGRMILKKVPGAATVYMIYDKRDRLSMTRDGNLGAADKWLVTIYDEHNRVIQTGLWNNSDSWTIHASQAAGSSNYYYPFNESSVPGSGWEMLSQQFYDNYTALTSGPTASYLSTWDGNFSSTDNNQWPYPQFPVQGNAHRNMGTWSKIKVLESSPAKYLVTVIIYDNKARLIQVKSENITGGTDVATTQYNWSGTPLVVVQKSEMGGTANPQTHAVVTKYTYDDLGRVLNIKKSVSSTVGINPVSVTKAEQLIVQNEYDKLGQLKKKILGANNLETENFEYNIRGWMLGMNRDYLNTGNANFFGFELGYDKLTNAAGRNFTAAQYNGNINGMIWKTKGDQTRRKYDFSYDPSNRFMQALFEQDNTGTWGNAIVDYTVKMGNGTNPMVAYDLNGNIKAMKQWGFTIGGSTSIDDITYTYQGPLSNKLKHVQDANNDWGGRLGDLKYDPTTKTTEDYTYDINGNLKTDKNKDIGTISYNHLNLPTSMAIHPDALTWDGFGGVVTYTYDASGNKLKKSVVETHNRIHLKNTFTHYINGFVYETSEKFYNSNPFPENYTDQLLYISHEEGRIRFIPATSSIAASFQFDYMLKDHLGNVRMVLTEEAPLAANYIATMEAANRTTEEQLFSMIAATEQNPKPAGFDNDNNNVIVSKVFNVSGTDQRVGPGVLLKVMAGDKFTAQVQSWYLPGSNTTVSSSTSILSSLASVFSGSVPAGGNHSGTEISNSGVLNTPVNGFLGYQGSVYNSNLPKAFLNWMVLDEQQFKLVNNNYGAIQVPLITGNMQKQAMQAAGGSQIEVKQNGYLYVYVSNESEGVVYFDDLKVEHIRGPIMEETHYYPFGLVMNRISSKALGPQGNKLKYNGKEEQREELSDRTGLDWTDYGARMYDNQIGRWMVVDPLSEISRRWSPYNYTLNNPLRYIDPDGMRWKKTQDKETADRLQAHIKNRKAEEASNLDAANKKMNKIKSQIAEKGTSEKLEKQLAAAIKEIANINDIVGALDASSRELKEMEEDITQEFTFKDIGGSEGQTYMENGVITMEATGDENAVHEAAHGYMIYKKEIIGGEKGKNKFPGGRDQFVQSEITAYRRQYAYNPADLNKNVPSYWGQIKSMSDIVRNWLLGVNNNRDYIYAGVMAPGVSANQVEKLLDDLKKQ